MEAYREFIELFVDVWHRGLQDPARTQAMTLEWLLEGYARTTYGQQFGADAILRLASESRDSGRLFEAYRQAFPIVTYDQIKPWIDRVVAGEVESLLPEPPVAWAMTRGTTRGTPKRIPITETDLGIRVAAARGLLNHLLRTDQLEAIDGYSLNLNYPSVMGTMDVAGRATPYGFSSGIYVRHAAAATPVEILPAQEEIDALGGGTTKADWQRRFEMVYQHTKDAPITLCAGVCPSILDFGQYLQRRHRVLPRKLWSMRAIAAASVPGIHTQFKPALRALYGPVDVVEMYIATEGTFAQQLDERQLLVPNYDLYFFEVLVEGGLSGLGHRPSPIEIEDDGLGHRPSPIETEDGELGRTPHAATRPPIKGGGRVKMLHEMQPGEYGSLIVSTPVLPRYRIGDLVRAFDPPYFRCIGREGRWTRLRYWLDGVRYLDLGRA